MVADVDIGRESGSSFRGSSRAVASDPRMPSRVERGSTRFHSNSRQKRLIQEQAQTRHSVSGSQAWSRITFRSFSVGSSRSLGEDFGDQPTSQHEAAAKLVVHIRCRRSSHEGPGSSDMYRPHLTGTVYHCITIDTSSSTSSTDTMSNALSRPLSPIIESPPTTPQKQPPPHQVATDTTSNTTSSNPGSGFHSLSSQPSSLRNPKSVTWGDLVAYRTIDPRAGDAAGNMEVDGSGYRSPDTEVSFLCRFVDLMLCIPIPLPRSRS